MFNLSRDINEYDLGVFFGLHYNRQHSINQGIRVLQHFGVLPNRNTLKFCPQCNNEHQLAVENDSNSQMGWQYRCPNVYEHVYEPTANTFLSKVQHISDLGADQVVKLLFGWVDNWTEGYFSRAKITEDTAEDIYTYFRDVAEKIAWHEYQPLGGVADIVEVYETPNEDIWLFGGRSRTTKRVFGRVVPNRYKETLFDVMMECIDSRSFIASNQCDGYVGCDQYFSGHGTVNRTRKEPAWVPVGRFSPECRDSRSIGLAPEAGVEPVQYHTRGIEREWRKLKDKVSGCNNLRMVDSYVGEWMYRCNILRHIPTRREKFQRFLKDMARVWPGIGAEPMSLDIDACLCRECKP